jgi:hypothetical protein
MTLEIHPSAVSNFDTKAAALVSLIKEIPVNPPRLPEFPSDIHTIAIKKEDILEFTEEAMTDYRGRTVARFFRSDKGCYGLDPNDYAKVIKLAERLQSLPGLRSKLSTFFIETSLFTWLRRNFKREEIDPSFTAFLVRQAEEAIETITLWTPVAYLEIEIPIPVSRSELRPLSKSVADRWEQYLKQFSKGKDDDSNLSAMFDPIRENYQGLAAVVTKVEAEPRRAIEFAREEAERITSVMAILSGAICRADIKCVSKIKGSENLGVGATILEFEADRFQVHEDVLDQSTNFWRLGREDIDDFRSVFLDKVSRLLAAESLN